VNLEMGAFLNDPNELNEEAEQTKSIGNEIMDMAQSFE